MFLAWRDLVISRLLVLFVLEPVAMVRINPHIIEQSASGIEPNRFRRRLRSAEVNICLVPWTRTRPITVAGLRPWNSLPATSRRSRDTELGEFKHTIEQFSNEQVNIYFAAQLLLCPVPNRRGIIIITRICAAEMAVRYAALSACRKVHVCHCNSLGGATWRSVTITGRTDRRTDRVRRNMRPLLGRRAA